MNSKIEPESSVTWLRWVAAWSVHLFTALGGVCALFATMAVFRHEWIPCFAWLAVAVVIDAADGTFARMADVKRILPGFDGALLDNLIDFLTYVFIPALFVYEAGMMPEPWRLAGASAIVVSSAYQFSQSDAKTDDHTFKGFPSYWNLVVLYLFLADAGPLTEAAVVLTCVVLAFVPIKYVYPSRTPRLRKLTLSLSTAWGFAMVAMVLLYPHVPAWLMFASLTYVAYYVGLSLVITLSSNQR